MTAKEAINVLLRELQCIERNDGIQCNRKCESCDLVMDAAVLKDAYNLAIKALKAQEWIPVKERLPEDEYVLISKMPTKISGDKWSVAIAIRIADPRNGEIQWKDSGFGVIQDDKVLAWMPMPEPYRESE